jgi:molecular chaperone DnaK
MSQTINFAIDLGTTNSLIAKYSGGRAEVFKNPINLKETLPSVVAFRKERIIVGDKAREMVEKDPSNVFSLFKRKMGTVETYHVPNIGEDRTPIQLSSLVLKELKNFVHSGETVDAVVITIPASFDTIQSNATKKAGLEAGFNEVILLQEPIAASLAFANKTENENQLDGQWLVYDLGGGTFDVALVRFEDGEMRVMDHEGDNFLGGLDFDALMIEKLVVPMLESKGDFGDINHEMKSDHGRYNKLYYALRQKAEEVKIQLSSSMSAEIEFTIEDLSGEEHDIYHVITRADFEAIIADKIFYTVDLMKDILTKNNLQTTDIQQIVMIGGSTYIPMVKRVIQDVLKINVNQNIDPTNAVAIGAAYFAGGKTKNTSATFGDKTVALQENKPASVVSLRAAYQKATQDMDEYYTAIVTGAAAGMSYRITRTDGGFDSGSKALTDRISEVLPLLKFSNNHFVVKIYDSNGNILNVENDQIEIIHGKFSIHGQPLPNDICIEIDDIENNVTKLGHLSFSLKSSLHFFYGQENKLSDQNEYEFI